MATSFRFRKSINLGPVRINFGKTGYTSWSVGGPGFRYTKGKHGTRTTVGLPGTGCSWSDYEKAPRANKAITAPAGPYRPEPSDHGQVVLAALGLCAVVGVLLWVFGI